MYLGIEEAVTSFARCMPMLYATKPRLQRVRLLLILPHLLCGMWHGCAETAQYAQLYSRPAPVDTVSDPGQQAL